jgi:hypothetical protein
MSMMFSSTSGVFILLSCLLFPNLFLVMIEGSLAEKFAIGGPELEWEKDQAQFRLDYTVHNTITPELVQYEIYEYDCKTVAEDQHPLNLTLVESVKDADEDGSSTTPTTTKTNMSLHVVLTTDEYQTWSSSSLYQKPWLLHKAHLKACIRFMLWTFPKGHQHSMEVNFEQTQVDLTLSNDGTIQAMEKSELEKIGISVRVMGSQQQQQQQQQQGPSKIVTPPPIDEEL